MKRVSPSMAVALLALFVALGGTGYAAAKINGRNIKDRSIPGTKLQRNTLSGAQIRESGLAKVPAASDADFLDGRPAGAYLLAGTGVAANSLRLEGKRASAFLPADGVAANSQLLQGNPASAFLPAGGTAANANLLDGRDSSDFLPAGKLMSAGPVSVAMGAEATLFTAGPLSIVGQCTDAGGAHPTALIGLRHSVPVYGPVGASGPTVVLAGGANLDEIATGAAGQIRRQPFGAVTAGGAAAALQGVATAISDDVAGQCVFAALGVTS